MSDKPETNEIKTILTMDDLAGRLGNPNTLITHDGRRIMLIPPGYQTHTSVFFRQNKLNVKGYRDFKVAVDLMTKSRVTMRQAACIYSQESPYIEIDKKEMHVSFWPDTDNGAEATVVMKLSLSKEIQRWVGGFTQESLLEQIETWGNDLALGDEQRMALALAVKNMELTSAIKFTAARSHGNVEIGFTSKDGGESFAALPEIWKLNVPVMEGMEVWPVELKLMVTVPRQEGQVPMFRFTCPKLDFYKEQAMEVVYNRLVADLPFPIIQV